MPGDKSLCWGINLYAGEHFSGLLAIIAQLTGINRDKQRILINKESGTRSSKSPSPSAHLRRANGPRLYFSSFRDSSLTIEGFG